MQIDFSFLNLDDLETSDQRTPQSVLDDRKRTEKEVREILQSMIEIVDEVDSMNEYTEESLKPIAEAIKQIYYKGSDKATKIFAKEISVKFLNYLAEITTH